jgi:hypothetical protein
MIRTRHATSFLAVIAGAALALAGAGCEKGGASDAKVAELEKRIKTLEETNATNKDAMAFLSKVYDQNKAQIEEEERRTHAPDAMWAVDITGNQIDGPASGAYVTIIEAWDFA